MSGMLRDLPSLPPLEQSQASPRRRLGSKSPDPFPPERMDLQPQPQSRAGDREETNKSPRGTKTSYDWKKQSMGDPMREFNKCQPCMIAQTCIPPHVRRKGEAQESRQAACFARLE